MYGQPYNKSLCHAWGASPIYLLGKYALGVRPTSPAYATYEVRPEIMCFGSFEGKVPTPNGTVEVKMDRESVTVCADVDGGTLVLGEKRYTIEKNIPLTIEV
jgi:alpha-L-rhamnosidase